MQMTVQNKWKGRKNKPKQKHVQTSRELLRIQSDLAKKKNVIWCQILRYRYKMEMEREKSSLRDCSVCGKQPNVAVTCSEDKDSSPRSNPKSKNQALVIHRPGHGL